VTNYKQRIKNRVIDYINHETKPYARKVPFLRINLSDISEYASESVLQFGKNLKGYLNGRRILRVVVHRGGSYMLPLTEEQARRRGNLGSKLGGFEISLEVGTVQRMMTSFAHEIGHTYFYDLVDDPPKLLVSESLLKERDYHRQFEGLAYDFGREVLLPREAFREYVRLNHDRPSLRSFQAMCEELKVSKEILSQRLLRDLKLWNACIFWGTVANVSGSLRDARETPRIVVGTRDKRKADFRTVSLSRELASDKSELRRTILETHEDGTHAGLRIVVARMDFLLDIRNKHLPGGDRYFTALLCPLQKAQRAEGERGEQLLINVPR
jgi:hypothetical protein